MNEPENDLGSNTQLSPAAPITPTGWAPQAAPAPSAPAAPVMAPLPNEVPTTPFESSIPDLTGPTGPSPLGGGASSGMEPAAPKNNTGLIIVLVVLILIGVLILAVWKGWLNFGDLLSQKTPTPSATPTESFIPISVVTKNDAARKADLANIKTALLKYYNDKQSYPISPVLAKASDPNGVLKDLVTNGYITQLPIDPLSPNSYYGYKSGGKSFTLSAALEDRTDPAGIPMGDLYLYQITDTSVEPPLVGPDAVSNTSATQGGIPLIQSGNSSATVSSSPTRSAVPSMQATINSSSSSSSSTSTDGSDSTSTDADAGAFSSSSSSITP